MTTHAEHLIVDAIQRGVAARGAELVTDTHRRMGEMLYAVTPGGLDPLGDKVSYSVTAGELHASVFGETGQTTPGGSPMQDWHTILKMSMTNEQRVAAVVDALVPEHDDDWTDQDYREAAELDLIRENFPTLNDEGLLPVEGPLTVGDLKQILANLEDGLHVVLATPDWYANVADIGIPTEGHFTAVTLFGGADFDTRQV